MVYLKKFVPKERNEHLAAFNCCGGGLPKFDADFLKFPGPLMPETPAFVLSSVRRLLRWFTDSCVFVCCTLSWCTDFCTHIGALGSCADSAQSSPQILWTL